MAKNKAGSVALWVIIGLLIVGLLGFGATDFGGSVRSVATVGDTEIDTNQYARALDNRIRGFQQQTGQALSFQEARQFGFDRLALSQLISDAALRNEVKEIGVSVGDENVSREITANPSFRNLSDEFDRNTYELALQQNGLTVREFEQQIRETMSTDLLRRAVGAGVATPSVLADTLYNFAEETRDVTWARLTAEDLQDPISEPAESDLVAFHTENPDQFTKPETKVIAYALLTPDMIVDNIDVDESQLQELYDSRADLYRQPERRLVERLVYPNDDAANEAKSRLDAGEASFEDLVADRGLGLADVDLGDARREDLGGAADAVFALEAPGVVGPLPSDFGPALYRMNAVLAAQELSLDDVRDDLTRELAGDRARRVINDQIGQVEDLLAGGATMDILAERTDMEAGTLEWDETVSEGIAAYDAFRREAATAAEGDFPRVVTLDDGGMFALSVSEVQPPALRPLDDVRKDVIAGWERAETGVALTTQAEALAEALRGGAEMAGMDLTLNTDRGVGRASFLDGTPANFVETVFGMAPNDVSVISADGEAWLIRLDAVVAPDTTSPEATLAIGQFSQQTSTALANSVISAFTQAVLEETGVNVNQAAINAVHAHLQ